MNDYLLVTPSGVKYDCPSTVSVVNVNELIHLWLGHKKVLGSNWYVKWRYSASISREVFLEMAKNSQKNDIKLSVIFGKYSSSIIPALIEMGIFDKITDELLEKAESLSLAKRKEIARIISKSETDEILHNLNVNNLFNVDEINGIEKVSSFKTQVNVFIDSKNIFCESVRPELCWSKIAKLIQKVKNSNWYNLDENLKKYKDEIGIWTEDADTSFPLVDLIDVQERCFGEMLDEVNLLKYSEESIAVFLQDYASNVKLSQLLSRFWKKSDHKILMISLCLHFSKGEDLLFRFISDEFLLDKIRKGECDDCLHNYLLSSSLIFGPETARRIIRWTQSDRK